MHNFLFRKKIFLVLVFFSVITSFFFWVFFSKISIVKTDVIIYGTSEDYVDSECLIIRDEIVLETPENGSTVFCVQDGEKIEAGREIARVYTNPQDTAEQERLKKIKEKIIDLEEKMEKFKNVNAKPGSVSQNLSKTICSITKTYLNNGTLKIKECKNSMIKALLDQKKIYSSTENFFNKLFELKQQKREIEERINSLNYKTVVASKPGYFKCCTDGFENSVDLDKILNLNPESLSDLLVIPQKKDQNKAKIVRSPYWYTLINIPTEKAKKLVCGNEVVLSSLSESIGKIPARIVAINFDQGGKNACIVLKSNYVSDETLSLRKENIHVSFNTYSGLKFSKKALHKKNITKKITDKSGKELLINHPSCGVYVKDLINNKAKFKFKEVNPIFIDEEFVTCKSGTSELDGIKLHDEVLIDTA